LFLLNSPTPNDTSQSLPVDRFQPTYSEYAVYPAIIQSWILRFGK
jgi:hypothetical protein